MISRAERNRKLARRSFLLSAGATAATLPFLRALPGYAQADAQPKLVLMFSACGRIRHLWGADASTGALQFRPNLAPLQPHAQHVTILEGIRNFGAPEIGGTHEGGMMSLFTGAGSGLTAESTSVGYPSIDTVFMANQSGTARSDSFYQQVVGEVNGARSASPNNRVVFDSSGVRRDPLRSSWEAVDQYLAGAIAPADPTQTGPSNEDLARTKLFETLNAQLGELESRLCSEDYYQMQAMRAAIDQASQSMANAVACELPTLPPRPDLPEYEPIWQPPAAKIDLVSEDDWYFQRGKLATDLLVVALACGVTRSGVLQFDQGASEVYANGQDLTHHVTSHGVPQLHEYLLMHQGMAPDYIYWTEDLQHAPPEAMLTQYGPVWQQLSQWELMYAKQFAYLVSQLEQFGILGDTAVLWGSELDDGQHNHFNMPFVMASGAQLPFQRGQVVHYPVSYADQTTRTEGVSPSLNDLLRTVLSGVGADVPSVGAAAHNQGLLDQLLT